MTEQQRIKRALSLINNVRAALAKMPGPANCNAITALASAQAYLATAYRAICDQALNSLEIVTPRRAALPSLAAYHNPNCDGSGPCSLGEVRVLPTSADPHGGNAILCRNCFWRESEWREERNLELSPEAQFPLPNWESLKVYGKEN